VSIGAVGFPVQEVSYGPGLHAWYAPPKRGSFVAVIVHGYQANRSHVLATARALHQLGVGVLCPDLGYVSGKSNFGGGDREATEVIDAVNYARSRSHLPIVLIGYSEGGAESILAAVRGAKVDAVVSDSAPVSFLSIASQRSGVPQWVLAGTYLVYPWFSGGAHLQNLADVLPGNYHVATFVIQGTSDTTVPWNDGVTIAHLTHGRLWLVRGAGHDGSLEKDPTLYVARVMSFLRAAISVAVRHGGA
jgi:pimeloyl-ACP methyl ester carboxylesterase